MMWETSNDVQDDNASILTRIYKASGNPAKANFNIDPGAATVHVALSGIYCLLLLVFNITV